MSTFKYLQDSKNNNVVVFQNLKSHTRRQVGESDSMKSIKQATNGQILIQTDSKIELWAKESVVENFGVDFSEVFKFYELQEGYLVVFKHGHLVIYGSDFSEVFATRPNLSGYITSKYCPVEETLTVCTTDQNKYVYQVSKTLKLKAREAISSTEDQCTGGQVTRKRHVAKIYLGSPRYISKK